MYVQFTRFVYGVIIFLYILERTIKSDIFFFENNSRFFSCNVSNLYEMKGSLISTFAKLFNPHMHKLGPGVPRTIFLVTSFTGKMPESSYSMYSSIFMLENIYHFTRSGPNSQEIVNFIPNMGPGGTKLNWSKIHNFL